MRSTPLGSLGTVIDYVDEYWKKHMINRGCYSSEILKERMYEVRIDATEGTTAFRSEELEVISNDEVAKKK